MRTVVWGCDWWGEYCEGCCASLDGERGSSSFFSGCLFSMWRSMCPSVS